MPMEIVFSFDTTGSMSSCLDEVRGRVSDMIQRLQADIPGIRIAIIAHGDYCDAKSSYVTKYENFTDDVAKLCEFVKSVGPTGGGDSDECYELVLHEVRTKLSWQPGSQRALVMIGDCEPHEPSYKLNKLNLNWRDEADSLEAIGVRIYAVQCSSYTESDKFYADIARRTHGHHLRLNDFKNIFDFLMAVCYREKGADLFDSYEKEVRARTGTVSKDMDKLFGDLRDKGLSKAASLTDKKPKAPKTLPLKKVSKTVSPKTPVKRVKRLSYKKPKVPLKLLPFTDKNLPLLRRENVPESNFLMKDFSWSAWHLVISPLNIGKARPGDKCGFRKQDLFGGKTNVPALYEISVQPKARGRKYVVYNKLCRKGFINGSRTLCWELTWEKYLLGRKDIRKQIDELVRKDCNIYIRRMVIKKTETSAKVRQALKRYDYAWKGLKSVRKCHRSVTKSTVDISTEMEI